MHYRTLPTQQEGHQDNAPRQHRRDRMGVVGSSAEGAPRTLLRGRESRTSSKLRHIRIRATSSETLTTSTSEVSEALGYRRCAKTRICPSSCRSRWSSTKSSNRTPSSYKYACGGVRCGWRRQSLSTMKKQARRSKSCASSTTQGRACSCSCSRCSTRTASSLGTCWPSDTRTRLP